MSEDAIFSKIKEHHCHCRNYNHTLKKNEFRSLK